MIFRSNVLNINIYAHKTSNSVLCVVFFILFFQLHIIHSQTDTVFHKTTSQKSLSVSRFFEHQTLNSTYYGLTLISQSIVAKKYNVNIRDMRLRYLDKFSNDYDTYLQFVPLGLTFTLKGLGFKNRSSWGELITSTSLSYGVGHGLVVLMKANLSVLRPDKRGANSFPSGHTTAAFIGASILSKEYKEQYPWVSIGGYTIATITGLSRLANNRHWICDVLFGAGLGILATEFSYALTDVIFNKNHPSTVAPFDDDMYEQTPSFANAFLSYNINLFKATQKLGNNTEYSIRNGIGIGMEVAYFPCKFVGIDIRTKSDGYVVDNRDIGLFEDSVMFVQSLEIGPAFSITLLQHINMGIRLGLGFNHIDGKYLQSNFPLGKQNNFQYSNGIYLNFWVERHTYLRFFADTYFTSIKVENKKRNFTTLSLGATIGLHF